MAGRVSLHGYECSILLLIALLIVALLLLFRKRRSAFDEFSTITSRARPSQIIFGMEVTPKKVSSKAQALWPGGEGEKVLAELGSSPESLRVKLAAIWLSHGSLDELKRWVGIGKVEARDVLVAAECPPEIWSDRASGADLDMDVGKRRSEYVQRYRAWLEDEMATLELREGATIEPATVRRLTRDAVALNEELGNPQDAAK